MEKRSSLFAHLESPIKRTAEEQELDDYLNMYEAKFGYLPFGSDFPELTMNMLRTAIESGIEIGVIPLPPNCLS
jgi:SRSO17 transposase